MTIKRKTVIL